MQTNRFVAHAFPALGTRPTSGDSSIAIPDPAQRELDRPATPIIRSPLLIPRRRAEDPSGPDDTLPDMLAPQVAIRRIMTPSGSASFVEVREEEQPLTGFPHEPVDRSAKLTVVIPNAEVVAASQQDESPPVSTPLPGLLSSVIRDATPSKRAMDAQSSALHSDEVARARAWALMCVGLPAACLALLPFLEAPPLRRAVYATALLYMMAVSAWVWVHTQDEENYTPFVFRFFGYSAAAVSLIVEYFLGVFAPTTLVVTLGLSFFGTGRDRAHAAGICAVAIGGFTILAILITTGVMDDVGAISAAGSSLAAQMTFIILCPLVMVATAWMARVSRRSADEAINHYREAESRARVHEAQLHEAHRDLEEALKAGAGREGPFTGCMAGRFKLTFVLGRGGMGVVYAAIDPDTGETAAIKLLKHQDGDGATDYQRFLREGRLASSLNLENVVQVHDCGRLVPFDVPYIAMERLRGRELATMLRRRSRLAVDEVAQLGLHLGQGLDGAHDAGIVHRDLKPRNIFWCEESRQWKILDFGICKLTGSSGTLTGLNQLIGTPNYMSPEQARGLSVDHRSDVFTLGSVLYRCLTGHPPFNGPDIPAVVFEIVFRHPELPSRLVPGLNPDVDRVIAIALSKEPWERFDSAGELGRALDAAISGSLSRQLRLRGDQALAYAMPISETTGSIRVRLPSPSRR